MKHTTLAPRPGTASSAQLSSYAHLRREEYLLVTGSRRLAAGEFALGVRWPAVQGDLPYDPRILAQTIRQTGLVVAHAEYGVPLTHQTMLSTLSFRIAPGLRIPRGRTSALDVHVTVSEAGGRRRTTSALHMTFQVLRDGEPLARAESEFTWISERVYDRLRGTRRSVHWGSWPVPAPLDARLAGRAGPSDVALSAGDRPGRLLLRNDPGNHLLFDHPVDHVPGLALLEAADQAAHTLHSPTPFTSTTIEATYWRYVEFDQPCWLETEPLPTPGAVRVTGTQQGEPAFRVDFGTTD
ncbi:ScbA/BarX family gamma-butyrolactone biosynthesis protein [Streptomyces lanatus]|uniref:ScbA/BarX family gamma-butyrolactone biosynthesis protein n=1 Tax=Streptomyces lanatus TaxID=66900 RepID=A0ABV1XJ75_9ACTN|nr:ScbA/BarX family gamma-butyrolactone biosynthesis protein [Streptomyces lanatus]GHG91373.1 adhesin [Streptomyces lanatus]